MRNGMENIGTLNSRNFISHNNELYTVLSKKCYVNISLLGHRKIRR